jgi:hypothetical protein
MASVFWNKNGRGFMCVCTIMVSFHVYSRPLQQFASQFQAFENCLLGLAGNIYATAVVDIRRLLHLQLQNITEDEFTSQVIPHPSGPKKLNAQQHIQVCSVVTSYRLIDIMARIIGLPSNGLEVNRGLYKVENKEPEVSA